MKSVTSTSLTIKQKLYKRGTERMDRFCKANSLTAPKVMVVPHADWHVGFCAYYRPEEGIKICLEECAFPASPYNPRQWTWPGSDTDREPYGVICHEMGHHLDLEVSYSKGAYYGNFSTAAMKESREKPLTGYSPNPAEWFAEMARLFITNHALLYLLRPRTWDLFVKRWEPVSDEDWREELGMGVPDRIVANLEKKIRETKGKNR
jgi:hypothetical protein